MTAYKNPFGLFLLETQKLKRTGFVPAFLGGGILAALVPAINMALRAETFTAQAGSPFHILMDANWQLMAQLNVFLLVCGACLLYHTEYADNGIQKVQVLPLWPFGLFLGKLWVLLFSCLLPLCMETASLLLCSIHWFPGGTVTGIQVLSSMAFELALLLPTGTAMLFIASMCQNMWLGLGMGVILVFFASMLPSHIPALQMLPFSSPYGMLHQFSPKEAGGMLCICLGEMILLSGAEHVYQTFRRYFA